RLGAAQRDVAGRVAGEHGQAVFGVGGQAGEGGGGDVSGGGGELVAVVVDVVRHHADGVGGGAPGERDAVHGDVATARLPRGGRCLGVAGGAAAQPVHVRATTGRRGGRPHLVGAGVERGGEGGVRPGVPVSGTGEGQRGAYQ